MPRKVLIIIFILSVLTFIVIRVIPKLKTSSTFEALEVEEKKPSKIKEEDIFKPPKLLIETIDKNYKEESFLIGRNIFRYGPPKATQTPQIPGQQPSREIVIAPPKVPPEPLATETGKIVPPPEKEHKKQPPPFNYKYLGFFGPQDKKLAVFSDGKEIMDVFEGEIIADKFIVKSIGYETVTIGFVGFPDDIIQKIEVGP